MNFRQKKRYASRLETASVKNALTENGRVRYATVRYDVVDKFGLPTVDTLGTISDNVWLRYGTTGHSSQI